MTILIGLAESNIFPYQFSTNIITNKRKKNAKLTSPNLPELIRKYPNFYSGQSVPTRAFPNRSEKFQTGPEFSRKMRAKIAQT